MMQSIWVAIPAAGQGKRFGGEQPKQYYNLNDKTVLEHTIARFSERDDVAGIVVAVSSRDEWIEGILLGPNVHVIEGGRERSDSVYACVKFIEEKASADDLIAVHDAARPCVRQSSLYRLFAKAKYAQYGCILALPATDTIKRVEREKILSTIDRSMVYMAQTPQVFPVSLLKLALENVKANKLEVTDDASAIELLGYSPEVVEGTKSNIKITTQDDIQVASLYIDQLIRECD